jgi:hypothetical protein
VMPKVLSEILFENLAEGTDNGGSVRTLQGQAEKEPTTF